MTTLTFKEFLQGLVIENVHPEIQSVIRGKGTPAQKQHDIAAKIRTIHRSGGETGLENNMPKGSSRAYLKHKDAHQTMIDGKPAEFHTGTKVAIRASLDQHHDKEKYGGTLGQLQNHAENGDRHANQNYRILTRHHDDKNEYTTNEEHGIFPPLVEHDHENGDWSHVGHSRDIKAGEFRKHTKTKEFPKGISHKDFTGALERRYERHHGRYWNTPEDAHLDKVDEHPLVQKFHDYHDNYASPPHDYRQMKNMGIFEHPHTGKAHIVARDHGFDSNVESAYKAARKVANYKANLKHY